jgi:hypothetical protein
MTKKGYEVINSNYNNPVIEYLKDRAAASDDDDSIVKLLHPTNDRSEMAEVYIANLGYNPVDFFDQAALEKAYDKLVESDRPFIARRRYDLTSRRSMIIEKTLELKNAKADAYVVDLLYQVIKSELGIEIYRDNAPRPAVPLRSNERTSSPRNAYTREEFVSAFEDDDDDTDSDDDTFDFDDED